MSHHRMTREDMRFHLAMSYDDEEMDEETRAAILDEFDDGDEEDEEDAEAEGLLRIVREAYPAVRDYDVRLGIDDDLTGCTLAWNGPHGRFLLKTSTNWNQIDGWIEEREDWAWSVDLYDRKALGVKLRSPAYRKYLIKGAGRAR